jgi:hypothetical protein
MKPERFGPNAVMLEDTVIPAYQITIEDEKIEFYFMLEDGAEHLAFQDDEEGKVYFVFWPLHAQFMQGLVTGDEYPETSMGSTYADWEEFLDSYTVFSKCVEEGELS